MLERIKKKIVDRWNVLRWGAFLPQSLMGLVFARWGGPARFLRNPLPWLAPYRRKELHVARHGGLGDTLMALPGLREVKRLNPGCRITYYSSFSGLLEGLPYINEVTFYDLERMPGNTVRYWVENSMPPKRHIAEMMADQLGVKITDLKPDCVVDPAIVRRFQDQWAELPRPWIVANRKSAGFAPNKDWFDDRWDTLITALGAKGTVIEIGNKPTDPLVPVTPARVDLRGRTTLAELAAAIAAADLLVSAPSGPTHIAAAVDTPAVVIVGGYEKPHSAGYPGNIYLSTDLPCSPCFKNTGCPYDKECLRRIDPSEVEEAVDRLWKSRDQAQSLHPAHDLGANSR